MRELRRTYRPNIVFIPCIFLASAVLLAGCASFSLDTGIISINPEADDPAPIQTGVATEAPPAPTDEAALEDFLDEEENEQFLVIEEIVIGMLFVAVVVGIAAHRLRVPYTVGLVLMGLALALGVQLDVSVSPNLILALLVPPLIFEAAFHINLSDLRHNLAHILTLAVPGVLLTTLVVGAIVSWGTHLALPLALVFGAVVSATDPVSVVALFRRMGVPRRLQVLLEGESLFNDGTAIVIFDLVLVLALTGLESFNWVFSLVDFVRVAGGGLVVGLVMGSLVSQLISRIDDYLIETTLTSILAFGAYLIGEVLGVSGVLAVVAAGLINGNIGPQGMSPTTKVVVYNFWEYVGFLANSFIFLLIGLQIELAVLFENWLLILWGVLSVLVARAVSIYLLARVGGGIPMKWQHVMYWGGLRGAIALALALSLPEALGDATTQIRVMVFGVVLFTLLVQGFSMSPLVRWLGIVERSETQEEYERRHARAVASRTAYEHLQHRHRQGLLSGHSWNILSPVLSEHNKSLTHSVQQVLSNAPELEAEEMDTAHREYLRAQRSTLNGLLKDGVISDAIYEQLVAEVDAALSKPQTNWPDLFGVAAGARSNVNRLMTAVVQEQDVENALSSLTKIGITVTCMPSQGMFLGRRNVTLWIGYAKGQEEAVVSAMDQSCRKRVQYKTPPLLDDLVPYVPIPVTVGGATIFTFEIEQFEIF